MARQCTRRLGGVFICSERFKAAQLHQQKSREKEIQRDIFNIFETSKGNEWFYNKTGLTQREILSAILTIPKEFEL